MGALLGRYFFHSGSLEVAVAAVECVDEAEAPMPRASARLRCPWAVVGPGPDKFRMQFPHGTIQHKPKNRRISTIRFQNLKYFQGNCMRN